MLVRNVDFIDELVSNLITAGIDSICFHVSSPDNVIVIIPLVERVAETTDELMGYFDEILPKEANHIEIVVRKTENCSSRTWQKALMSISECKKLNVISSE